MDVADPLFATEKVLMAGLLVWLGLRLIDLSMGIYTKAESLRPHRNLGDMIVPVSVRLGKAVVLLLVEQATEPQKPEGQGDGIQAIEWISGAMGNDGRARTSR
jgi:hypothetical protein